MIRVAISRGFVASVACTTLVGYTFLTVLVEVGEALAFGEDEYFFGTLAVVVAAALFDRTNHHNISRRRTRQGQARRARHMT
jgi:hypothetical protein